jgi:HEAT repeats
MLGLRGRPGSKVTRALLTLARDADTGLRWAAADALGGRPGSKVTNALIALVGDADTDRDVRGAAEQELALRIDPRIIKWFVQLSSKRPAEPPTSMQFPDDTNLWYRTAIAIANNSRSWPAGERDRLIDALAKYTAAVTAVRKDR